MSRQIDEKFLLSLLQTEITRLLLNSPAEKINRNLKIYPITLIKIGTVFSSLLLVWLLKFVQYCRIISLFISKLNFIHPDHCSAISVRINQIAIFFTQKTEWSSTWSIADYIIWNFYTSESNIFPSNIINQILLQINDVHQNEFSKWNETYKRYNSDLPV